MVEDGLVSVVIPGYNGERFLGPTLASALAQTYQPIEIVVVDDGSTDGTAAVVEAAATDDSRIRFFRRRNSGVAATRNFGIGQARGSLIAPLDNDDLWHPEKIAREVKVMLASSPKVGLVYCWSVAIDENDFVILPVRRKIAIQGHVTAELAKGNFIETSSSPLIKRSCIDAVGGYDATLKPHGADDWKLYLALSEFCEFAVVPEYLVGYRQFAGSLSRDVAAMEQSTELVARWLYEKWPDLPEKLRRERKYKTCVYLAQLALDNNNFSAALRYRAQAYKVRPLGLPERSAFEFAVRFLARKLGLRRTELRRKGWALNKSVSFGEFGAMRQFRTTFKNVGP